MAAVARKVGLVPSALYRHFKSKDDIIDSIPEIIRELLMANVRIVCKETANPLEQLERLLMRHVRLIRESRGIPRLVFSEDFHSGHPERRRRIYAAIREYLDKIGQIVEQGKVRGKIRPGLDPRTVSIMFLGLFQPAAVLWHLSGGRFNVEKHARKAWRILAEALRP